MRNTKQKINPFQTIKNIFMFKLTAFVCVVGNMKLQVIAKVNNQQKIVSIMHSCN